MPAHELIPEAAPPVTAIVVAYDAGDDLMRCVESLVAQECTIEVIVVNNGSQDGSVEFAQLRYPQIRVLSNGTNDGFAGGANRGAATASGQALIFLNADVILEQGCAIALLAALTESQGRIVCGPLLVDASHLTVEYGATIDWAGDLVGLVAPRPPIYMSGCALAITRNVFVELGGFDASFFMFCEDLDLCWRALLHGCDVRVVEGARVSHRGGGSSPGGYVSNGRMEVTASRIALRERNTLATLVRCGPLGWLVLVLPARLLRIGMIAVAAVAFRRSDLAHALARAIAWNIRRFPELLRQRRALPATPALRRRVLRERMLRDLNSVRMLLRHGFPHFVDRTSQP
jgi:N-acetylglucosaminyl-diphospho-decaprenol L-rhamnosyltransferase